MNVSRETIYAALFAKLQNAAPFVTTSRRIEMWAKVASSRQPALYQSQIGETVTSVKGLPSKYLLRLDIHLYAYEPDPKVSCAIRLNALVDAVEAALAPPPAQITQTLGGLVSHCYINGAIETDEGALGPQGVAIIPVEILTT